MIKLLKKFFRLFWVTKVLELGPNDYLLIFYNENECSPADIDDASRFFGEYFSNDRFILAPNRKYGKECRNV